MVIANLVCQVDAPSSSACETTCNHRTLCQQDPALERRFQQVLVAEPNVIDTISILRGLRERCVALRHTARCGMCGSDLPPSQVQRGICIGC
jgi:hypothetical protein